ncbi:MAG: type II secretion system F family protein [Blautia sp.]
MNNSYSKYRFTPLEWIRYIAESILLCAVINDLCYRSFITFFFLLPLPFWYISMRRRQLLLQRKQRLHHQFRDTLNAINTAVSAGYSLENAVLEARKDLNRIYGPDSEMSQELAYMAAQMRLSVPVEKLFYDLGCKSQVEDIRNFSQILVQSKRMGGNMRETLQKSVHIIEDKIDVKKEIDAMLAARKMEHNFMSLMPAGIVLYMRITSPGFLDVLYHNTAGILLMTLCLILYAGAFFWGRRMAGIEI